MNRLCIAVLLTASAIHAASAFAGRWDMTIKTDNEIYPSWIEVTDNNGTLSARVQPKDGSVKPVTSIKLEGSQLVVVFEWHGAVTWNLAASGNRITGTQKMKSGAAAEVTGVRAPVLKNPAPKAWTDPEPLFNGKDLSGWEPMDPAHNHWVAQQGVLVNMEHGSNLKTQRRFEDFKLHFELNCPDGGNSGFYLRGRYEIQVAYERGPDNFHSMGSIYGMLAPSVDMPRKPGQWESFDATLIGRWITLVRDGTTILNNVEIPGITGGALDSNESEPGPFYIQGDHTGGMKYRNITVSVPKR